MYRWVYHSLFWLFWVIIFFYYNPESNLQGFLYWLIILGIMAVVIYSNLYFLLPRYYFKKKYLKYSLSLSILLVFGLIMFKVLLPSANSASKYSYLQDTINLLTMIIITSSLKFYREFIRKQELLIKAENEQLKTELSLLKAQVNPHFLFNTLNNLYGLMLQNKSEQASEITLKLSDLMRYLLESSKAEKVSLQKEVKFLEDYLALEKIRLSQQADIRLEVSGIEKEVFVAPLLFIPLVENAFKHGLQTLSKDSFAHFSLALQGNELYFEAYNSVGETLENQAKSGTGLYNLRKRLTLIYPEKHFLEIEKKENFFKVTLQISL